MSEDKSPPTDPGLDINKLTFDELDRLSEQQIAALNSQFRGKEITTLTRNELYITIKALPSKRGMKDRMSIGVNLLCLLLKNENSEQILDFARDVAAILKKDGWLYPYDMDRKDRQATARAGMGKRAKKLAGALLLALPAAGWVGGVAAGGAARGIEYVYTPPDTAGSSVSKNQPGKTAEDRMPENILIAHDTLAGIHDLIVNKYWEVLLALESLGVIGQAAKNIKQIEPENVDEIANAVGRLTEEYPELAESHKKRRRPLRERHDSDQTKLR